MHEGRIILDIAGPEREKLKISDLLRLFEKAGGKPLDTDRLLLAR